MAAVEVQDPGAGSVVGVCESATNRWNIPPEPTIAHVAGISQGVLVLRPCALTVCYSVTPPDDHCNALLLPTGVVWDIQPQSHDIGGV